MPALMELYAEISARTGGFDRAIAGTHARSVALAGQFGRTRDAGGRFTSGIGASATTMAGRYIDSAGRMREANGRFVAGMGRVQTSVSGVNKHFAGLQTGLGGIGKAFGVVGVAVGTVAGNIAGKLAAMVAPLAGDVLGGAAIAMEDRMAGLAKAANLGGPALDGMKQGLFDMSTSLKGVKLDDLIAIATVGAKMGVGEKDLLRYTEGIAKVSIALDDMAPADIANSIGQINNVWKLGVDGAFQLGSAVDALADSGASSADQIFNVMQRVGKSTKGLGMSAQETLALATAISDTGTRSEQAATSLVQLTNALVDTESHATFAKVLGISTDEFAARVKAGPMETLKAFLAQLQQFESGSQNKILKGIGIEGVQNPTEIKGLAESLDTISRHTETANREFATLNQLTNSYAVNSELTSSAITVAENKFQIMAATIGEQMLPVIGLATDIFGAFVDGITTGVIRNEADLASLRESMVATAQEAGKMTATVLNSLGAFPNALTAAGLDILGLFNEDAAKAAEDLRAAEAGRLLAEALPGGKSETKAPRPEPKSRTPTVIPDLPRGLVGPPEPPAGDKRIFDDAAAKKDAREFRSESVGLADFAARFRQSQFTGRDREAEARKEAELNRLELRKNTEALKQQMQGFGFLK